MRAFRESLFRGALWLPPLLTVALVVRDIAPAEGKLGHDYNHFFTRLYIGAVHFWQNGLAVPHYTPSLCGGIPFFADPQSVYYSLPQLLTFFVDPLPATLLTVAVFYGLAYLGFLRLGKEIFGFERVAAHLGALLFLLNGFAYAHLYVGHFTHHSYLLFPWVLYYLFRARVVPFSLLLIYALYSGGMHVLVVFAMGLLFVSPCLFARRPVREWLAFCAKSTVVLGLACSGKIVASLLFSRQFYYRAIDSSGTDLWTLVTRYFWFAPASTPEQLPFGGMVFGAWEYVGFVSKLTIPALILFPVLRALRRDGPKLASIMAYPLLLIGICVVASGSRWNLALPFFNHYHNPIKILGAIVPFLCLLTAYVVDGILRLPVLRGFSPVSSPLIYLLVGLILVGEFRGYCKFFLGIKPARTYVYSSEIYQKLREARRLPVVSRVIPAAHADDVGVMGGCTSLLCYEPLFGYGREGMKTSLVPGATSLVRAGRFNLTHPGCLLYPSYFHCKPWDRVEAADRENFDRFAHGESTAWGVPAWQSRLLSFNFIFIGILLLHAAGLTAWFRRFAGRSAISLIPREEGA